ncbi:hypothetical protein [Roseateles sp.]|uniref:hypothetical protein n=1 Tax=Roseateles sp. TaxID=1971397 RepID=UPI003D0FED66
MNEKQKKQRGAKPGRQRERQANKQTSTPALLVSVQTHELSASHLARVVAVSRAVVNPR